MRFSLLKDTLREIWKSRNRFLSILAIVVLGSGFFAGVQATAPDMLLTADAYYKEKNLMEIKLISTYGFNENDIATIRQVEGVRGVLPTYSQNLFLKTAEGRSVIAKVTALPDGSLPTYADPTINELALQSGRMPENPGECLVEQYAQIGDTITLFPEEGSDPLTDTMARDSFTVVGIVRSPQYIAIERGIADIGNGSVDCLVFIPQENFTLDIYTELYLTLEDTQNLSYHAQAYKDTVDRYKNILEKAGDVRVEERYQEILDEAAVELDKAKAELQDGVETQQRELADARQKLEDASVEILDARQELQDARTKLDDGYLELAENEEKFQVEIKKAEEKLADAWEQLEDGQDAYLYGYKQYLDGKRLLAAGKTEFETKFALFTAQKEKLAQGRAELEAATGALKEQLKQVGSSVQLLSTAQGYAHSYAPGLGDTALEEKLIEGLGAYDGMLRNLFSTYLANPQPETLAALDSGFSEGMRRLNTVEQALTDGIQQVENSDAAKELLAGEALLAAAEPEIAAGKAYLEEGEARLKAADTQLAAAGKELQRNTKKLESAQKTFEENKVDGPKKLAEAKQELADGEADYLEGLEKLAEGEADYRQGLVDYDTGKRDSDAEIADARQKIADAEHDLATLKRPVWYVFDRSTNPGYTNFTDDAYRIEAIAKVFPLFFILVAALVCLTTMTRMIEEQRTQMGTLKALGYGRGAILFKFLFYALAATLLGCLIGLGVGFKLFPSVIFGAYGIMYNLPDVIAPFWIPSALLITGSFLLCTTVVVLAACAQEMRTEPSQLMRPKAPKAGKRVLLERIPALWSRLGFIQKVTVRNLFRYKKRIAMTVLGISGCTALLLTGFGLRDSISAVGEKQYGEVFYYDALLITDEKAEEEDRAALDSLVRGDSLTKDALLIRQETMKGGNGERSYEATLFIPQEPEKVTEFVALHTREEKTPIALADGGVVVTEKLATLLGLSIGDSLELEDTENRKVSLPITGITENYTFHYLYLTPETYRSLYGEAPGYNTYVINLNDTGEEAQNAFSTRVVENKATLATYFSTDTRATFGDVVGSLSYVVLVLIVCAGALAFVVLYNLTNINITERIREIATIKVLGFNDREVSAYVYRENLILTAMGMVTGLMLGVVLHRFVMQTAEVETLMFGRSIEPLSFLLAGVFTMAFAALVNFFMFFKLRKVNMVESLKSIE